MLERQPAVFACCIQTSEGIHSVSFASISKISDDSQRRVQVKKKMPRWACRVMIILTASICSMSLSSVAGAIEVDNFYTNGKSEELLDEFESRVDDIWGSKLIPNHIEVRARKYHPMVQSYAEKHNLEPALIMAIIHTESMFNPRARSRAPAYGLMQLVPYSGARDAYLKIYGRKRQLTSQYLYDPKNNIELGVAYLNILRNNYMKLIENPISRTYCAVAAYNAGAANVGSAFVPKKSMKMAIPVIKTMEPQEVYARLVDKLPFKENRNYIQKVLSRSDLYSKW
jgi:membrane-bound lytic murein transglycosylase MltF